MGQQEKRKRQQRETRATEGIVLEELDYLRLAQARGKVNEAVLQGQAEVQQAQGLAEQRVKGAQTALATMVKTLGRKYNFDAMAEYRTDDKRNMLLPVVK
jgi:hypothetical protein